jgi:uncharacterized protein (TIGR03546 family)
MLRKPLQHVLFLRKALPGRGDSPRQLAMGLALGLMLGLVPKGNLTAVAISVFIFASTVNIGTAMLTATVVSFAGSWIDPVSHRIGIVLLTHESLEPQWTRLYQMPVVPWTDLHNTVVAGGLVLGIILFLPAYYFSRPVFQRYWVSRDDSDTPPSTVALDKPARTSPSRPETHLSDIPPSEPNAFPGTLEVTRPRRRAA